MRERGQCLLQERRRRRMLADEVADFSADLHDTVDSVASCCLGNGRISYIAI